MHLLGFAIPDFSIFSSHDSSVGPFPDHPVWNATHLQHTSIIVIHEQLAPFPFSIVLFHNFFFLVHITPPQLIDRFQEIECFIFTCVASVPGIVLALGKAQWILLIELLGVGLERYLMERFNGWMNECIATFLLIIINLYIRLSTQIFIHWLKKKIPEYPCLCSLPFLTVKTQCLCKISLYFIYLLFHLCIMWIFLPHPHSHLSLPTSSDASGSQKSLLCWISKAFNLQYGC